MESRWRKDNPDIKPDLREANLKGIHLYLAKLSKVTFFGAQMQAAYLVGSDLSLADLQFANLYGANLSMATLNGAHLRRSLFTATNLNAAVLKKRGLVKRT